MTARELYEALWGHLVGEPPWEALTPREQAGWLHVDGRDDTPPGDPATLTEAETDDLVDDDIGYWLGNPFVSPDLIRAKIAHWIATAYAAGLAARTDPEGGP